MVPFFLAMDFSTGLVTGGVELVGNMEEGVVQFGVMMLGRPLCSVSDESTISAKEGKIVSRD